MPPNNKKKKRSQPAAVRGFATTSVASRHKQNLELSEKSESTATSDAGDTDSATPATERDASKPNNDVPTKELHELSPEELEARLEEEELQSLVDKYATRTSRDASRQITKLTTDCRVLRSQAIPLHTATLLSEPSKDKILNLAKREVNDGLYVNDQRPAKRLKVEDTLPRLWTIQRVLAALGFTISQVNDALKHIVAHAPSTPASDPLWGLDECLDFLVLNTPAEELPVFDTRTGRPRDVNSFQESTAAAPQISEPDASFLISRSNNDFERPSSSQQIHDTSTTDTTQEDEDIAVSDLESDLEPEELLSMYIAARSRLYKLRPELADSQTTPGKYSKRNTKATKKAAPASRGISKLQDNIRKIEHDILFDKHEADEQWAVRRNELAQELADERRHLSETRTNKADDETSQMVEPGATNGTLSLQDNGHSLDIATDGSTDDEEEEDIIGGLFDAAAGIGTMNLIEKSSTSDGDLDSKSVTIRDFGKPKGLSTKRILEEACRARDSNVKLSYKTISTTSFSNRQLLSIVWSKEQDTTLALESTTISSHATPKSTSFIMKTVSTPTSYQSEELLSTFALFQVFAPSAKEEKVYLRLPAVWREYWEELSKQRKTQVESSERLNVKQLQALVQSELKEDEDEDVIYTNNIKRRYGGADGSKTPENREVPLEKVTPEQLEQIWRAKSSSTAYQKMLAVRDSLPISQFRNQALATIENNQVTIICGETGCGKSTQMPSFILERELSNGRPCKIYCAEPRRISAVTLAQRVSEELGEGKNDLGTSKSLVGFAIRLQNEVVSSTRLVYATTGIVLRMLESADGFKDVTHIIIDEVHERSIETDFLLIILRTLTSKRPDLKIILMSATVDAQRFSVYFHGAPTLDVPGRTFPVETKFLEDAIELTGHIVNETDTEEAHDESLPEDDDRNGEANTASSDLRQCSPQTRSTLQKVNEYTIDYELICRLIDFVSSDINYSKYGKAILVFLPGIQEIRRLQDMLSGTASSQRYLIHTLHSTIASEDQQRAFTLPPRGLGKIVLSTNIAETGVTIPDITCVIDTGKHKEMRFDEKRQVSRLIESFISRANAKQRRGRAGRVQHGLAFHLFTKHRHDHGIAEQQTPEMLRLSLQDLIMRVKITGLGDIQTALGDALDPPSSKNIRHAIDTLIEVGALTQSEELTPLGLQLSKMPLDPYLGKLVLFGCLFKCLDVCLTLAALLTSKSPFVTPVGARKQADLARLAFKKGDSDLLTEYNAYEAWRRVCSAGGISEWQFCKKNCLSAQTLANIEDLKAQLLTAVSESGLVNLSGQERSANGRIHNTGGRQRRFVSIPEPFDDSRDNNEVITAVIAWSFYPKLLVREGKGWRSVASSQHIHLHPTSIVRHTPTTNFSYLSYYSILQSSGTKNYNANSLTPVAPFHLAILAGEATFYPTAHVIAVDGARLRFSVDSWKSFVALKYLRRRLEEIVVRRWKKPGADLVARLQLWMDIWNEIIVGWKGKSD